MTSQKSKRTSEGWMVYFGSVLGTFFLVFGIIDDYVRVLFLVLAVISFGVAVVGVLKHRR